MIVEPKPRACYKCGGPLVVSVLSAAEGDGTGLLRPIHKTLKVVCPHCATTIYENA